jgi:hypothetical protein
MDVSPQSEKTKTGMAADERRYNPILSYPRSSAFIGGS